MPLSRTRRKARAASYLYHQHIRPLLVFSNANKHALDHISKIRRMPSNRLESLLKNFSQINNRVFEMKTARSGIRVRLKFMGETYEAVGEEEKDLEEQVMRDAWNDLIYNGGWSATEARLQRVIGDFESLNSKEKKFLKEKRRHEEGGEIRHEFQQACIRAEVNPKLMSLFREPPFRFAVRVDSRDLIVLGKWSNSREKAKLSAMENALNYIKSLKRPKQDAALSTNLMARDSTSKKMRMIRLSKMITDEEDFAMHSMFKTVSEEREEWVRDNAAGTMGASDSTGVTSKRSKKRKTMGGEEAPQLMPRGTASREITSRSTQASPPQTTTPPESPLDLAVRPPLTPDPIDEELMRDRVLLETEQELSLTAPPHTKSQAKPHKYYLYYVETTNLSKKLKHWYRDWSFALISRHKMDTPFTVNLHQGAQITVSRAQVPASFTSTEINKLKDFSRKALGQMKVKSGVRQFFPYLIAPLVKENIYWDELEEDSSVSIDWKLVESVPKMLSGSLPLVRVTLAEIPPQHIFDAVVFSNGRYWAVTPESGVLAGSDVESYTLYAIPTTSTKEPSSAKTRTLSIHDVVTVHPLERRVLESLFSFPLIAQKLDRQVMVQHFLREYKISEDSRQPTVYQRQLLMHAFKLPPSTMFETLEYIGDQFLQVVSSIIRVRQFYEKDHGSGEFSPNQSRIAVTNKNLAQMGSNANLQKYIVVTSSPRTYVHITEASHGFSITSKLFADVVESVIGSLFIGFGSNEAYNFVRTLKVLPHKHGDLLLTPWKLPTDYEEHPELEKIQRVLQHEFSYPYLLSDAIQLHDPQVAALGRSLVQLILMLYFQRHSKRITANQLYLKVNAALQPATVARVIVKSDLFQCLPVHRVANEDVVQFLVGDTNHSLPVNTLTKTFYSIAGSLFLDLYTEVSDVYSLTEIIFEWRQCMQPLLYALVRSQLKDANDPLRELLAALGPMKDKLEFREYTANLCDIMIGDRVLARGVDANDAAGARRKGLVEAYRRVLGARVKHSQKRIRGQV